MIFPFCILSTVNEFKYSVSDLRAFPYIKAESEVIYDDLVHAYQESEKTKQPWVLIVDADDIEKEVEFEQQNLEKNFIYNRDILQHVVHPVFANYQFY